MRIYTLYPDIAPKAYKKWCSKQSISNHDTKALYSKIKNLWISTKRSATGVRDFHSSFRDLPSCGSALDTRLLQRPPDASADDAALSEST